MSLLGGVGAIVDPILDPLLGGSGTGNEDVSVDDPTSGDAADSVTDAVDEVADALGITVDVDVELGDSGESLSFGHGGGTSMDSSAVKYDFTGEDEKDFIVDSERAYAIAQQSTFMNRNMIDGLAAHTQQLGAGDAFGLEAAMAGVEQASPLEQFRESQAEASAE